MKNGENKQGDKLKEEGENKSPQSRKTGKGLLTPIIRSDK